MEDTVFVLDASVFIEAARRYYAFDLAPGFWDNLIHHAENGKVHSIDRVKKELEQGKDQLSIWVQDNFSNAFFPTDEEEINIFYIGIINWVHSEDQYLDAAKTEFADGADGNSRRIMFQHTA